MYSAYKRDVWVWRSKTTEQQQSKTGKLVLTNSANIEREKERKREREYEKVEIRETLNNWE